MPGQINVGDAVMTFLADQTRLDAAFDGVGPKAEAAFAPAAEAAEDAGERMTSSMGEARGEVALLGEEFGIRLPRHVRTFIAELPGVGEALSAAFSATAVLFIAQALVQATDKLSNFVANTLIFTDAMKESNAEVEAENKTMLALAGIYNTAKQRLEELNGETKSWEQTQRDAAQATIDQAKAQLAQMEATIANKSGWDKAKDTMKDVAGTILGQLIPGYYRLTSAMQDQIAVEEKRSAVTLATSQAQRAVNEVNAEEAAKNAKAAIDNAMRELELHKRIALSYAQDDQEKYELDQEYEEKKLALLNSYAVKDKAAIEALMLEIETQQAQHADKVAAAFVKMLQMVGEAQSHAAELVKDSTLANTIALTPLQAALQKAENAAHAMGITLRTDLVDALEKAKEAELAFAESGIVDKTTMEALQKATADAQKALDNYGHSVDTFKVKSGMWAEFQQEAKGGATAMDLVKQSGVQAFDDMSKNIQGAFQSIILGQGNVVKELEKATAASIAQIASQAAVKALFYTAEGTAALFTPGLQATAAGYFTAAGEMAAIAVLGGVAAHELGGAGGGGSQSTAQSAEGGNSNTGQSNRSGGGGVSGIQQFADGGLISAPTLAVVGEEFNREAVLPLDDPRAMSDIGKAIGQHGGGGSSIHFHGPVIGASDVAHLCKVISRQVGKGQAQLTASNSLRLTKRSA